MRREMLLEQRNVPRQDRLAAQHDGSKVRKLLPILEGVRDMAKQRGNPLRNGERLRLEPPNELRNPGVGHGKRAQRRAIE